MAGIFDITRGAFDSSEAARLHEAFAIALHGLRASHEVDRTIVNKLARSVVKVAQSEADCLRNDGTIDPARLAQRAILRMLQTSAPPREPATSESIEPRARGNGVPMAPPESVGKIMLRLFERTPFSKL